MVARATRGQWAREHICEHLTQEGLRRTGPTDVWRCTVCSWPKHTAGSALPTTSDFAPSANDGEVAIDERTALRNELGHKSDDKLLLTAQRERLDAAYCNSSLTPEPDDKGFQKGVGFGLTVTGYVCNADGGCDTELNVSKYPDSAPLDWRIQSGAFAEVRLLKEVQLGSAPISSSTGPGTIAGTPPGTDSPTLYQPTPNLAVGSSV